MNKLDRIFQLSVIGAAICLVYELGNAELISIKAISIMGGGFAVIALTSFLFAMKLKSKELRIKERSLREKERFLRRKEEELNNKRSKK